MTLTRTPVTIHRNETAVLSHLRHTASLTLTNLVALTNLSRPTVEETVLQLVERGLVTLVAPEPESTRKVGRPAKRYAFRAAAGHVMACDVGVERMRSMVATLDGAVIGREEAPIPTSSTPAQRMAAVMKATTGLLDRLGIAKEDIWSAGIATTGIVDGTGQVVRSSRLPELSGSNLAQEWARLLPDAAIAVGNDGRCAALAEHWMGAAVDVDTSVTVVVGTTLAAAITIDGRPYLGWHGASGEVGGIAELGWPRAAAALAPLRSAVDLTQEVLTEFVEALAPGLVALVSIIDPPRVIIGGELAEAADALILSLRRILEERCLFPVDIRRSALGDESTVLGALRLALDGVDARLGKPSPVKPDVALLTQNPW